MLVGIRVVLRVVDRHRAPVLEIEPVEDARDRHDKGLVVLPLEPSLDDLQVQETQEAAAVPLPECDGGVLLVDERGVVQFEFFERLREPRVILR